MLQSRPRHHHHHSLFNHGISFIKMLIQRAVQKSCNIITLVSVVIKTVLKSQMREK